MTTTTADQVRQTVREQYGEIARLGTSCCGPAPVPGQAPRSCCGGGGDVTHLATVLGYGADALAALPEAANLGLSCGNPTALASLRPGETVLDLGSGAGLDCFIAGPLVGAGGRAIGVDMTPDMLSRARANVAQYARRTGLANVEFRLGEIEHLPVADASVDVVISNCVLNLSPDKPQVWREVARVLKPGGRVAISDLALRRPLPPAVAGSVAALVGCVAGAALLDDQRRDALAAGLVDFTVEEKSGNLQAMLDTNGQFYRDLVAALPTGLTLDDYVVSANLSAVKPARP